MLRRPSSVAEPDRSNHKVALKAGMQESQKSASQRPTFEDYPRWLVQVRGVNRAMLSSDLYENTVTNIAATLKKSQLYATLTGVLPNLRDEYQEQCKQVLFHASSAININEKSHRSFLLKTYRKNIKDNESFPDAPKGGWLLPANWFEKINDVVRTELVAKYLDGAKFIGKRLESLLSPAPSINFEARESGYYAIHIIASFMAKIQTEPLVYLEIAVPFEIQITTQLQEVMRSLTHPAYERAREAPPPVTAEVWQWDYNSEAFSLNYLGHMLRYIEGAIMQIREKREHDANY